MPVKVYKCSYCQETHKIIDIIINHEKECSYNPDNKKCGTCSKLVSNYHSYDCSDENDTWDINEKELTCLYHVLDDYYRRIYINKNDEIDENLDKYLSKYIGINSEKLDL